MGLLDDAIREHLELKRQRGADPGEVAREQREALTPVPRDSTDSSDDVDADVVAPMAADADADAMTADDGQMPADAGQMPAASAVPAQDQTEPTDPATDGETVELDMQSVLGDEHLENPSAGTAAPVPAVPADRRAESPLAEEDSLEWELPGEVSAQAAADEHPNQQENAEDVLEETPDFLRDTPEQDRLWFEQQPPRDFDFDK